MNEFAIKKNYFCYYCGNNHSGNFKSNCLHYTCKKCYLDRNCLLCNNSTFITFIETNINNNSKKRKFKDISQVDDSSNKFLGDSRKVSIKVNKVIDEMMKDFELLDYALVERENYEGFVFNDVNKTNQKVKRNKLF